VVVTEGEVVLRRAADLAGPGPLTVGPLTVGPGRSAWIPAPGGDVTIDGAGTVFRCGVGDV
jgi:hypothetical protein